MISGRRTGVGDDGREHIVRLFGGVLGGACRGTSGERASERAFGCEVDVPQQHRGRDI